MKIIKTIIFGLFSLTMLIGVELFVLIPAFNVASTLVNLIGVFGSFVVIYGIGHTLYWVWKNITKEL